MDNRMVKCIWGSRCIQWVGRNAMGSSGAILLMWDSRKVTVKDHWTGVYSATAVVEDMDIKQKWMVTLVYGPNNSSDRAELWGKLNSIRRSGMGLGVWERTL